MKSNIKSFYDTRKHIITELEEKYPYVKDTPFDIRANAIKDAHTATMNAIKLSRKTHKYVELTYRTKKDLTQSIFIPKKSVKTNGFYVRILKDMKYSESIKESEINGDCRLCYKKTIGYYLLITCKEKEKSHKKQEKIDKYCSIDPGIRTFATIYSPSSIMEIGNTDIKRIDRLQSHADNIKKEMNNVKSRKRQKLNKAMLKINLKVRNLVKELHYKTGKFICKNFQNILIPTFETQDLVMKKDGKRKLSKKTSRNTMTWSHYLFRCRLIHQARKYGSNIYIVNESYTSKTCSSCGHINDKLGSSKVFNCPKCKVKIDRDINGARGIYIRQMSIGKT